MLEAHAEPLDPTLEAVDWRMLRLEVQAYLDEIVSPLRERGLAAEAVMAEGKAADEIVQRLREEAVDLVVLSAYGHGGVCEFAAGGTVRKVLSLAHGSVLLVRPAEEGASPEEPVAYRRILVPLDGSAIAEWALHHAAGIARAQGAELLLLHVEPTAAPAWGGLPPPPEEQELIRRLGELRRRRAHDYLGRKQAELADAEPPARTRLVSADRVATAILKVAAEEGVDLIAFSAHGEGAAPGACGTIAERLLAGSPIPVLFFQDRPGGP